MLNIGYNIICRNWRCGRNEVDCIAARGDLAVFVEIKTRRHFGFGFPEESVDAAKKNRLKLAAEAFMETHPEYAALRFDIVSILLSPSDQIRELVHLEDVFY